VADDRRLRGIDGSLTSGQLPINGDRFPELNVLIANAGISQAEDMMSESWDARAGQAMVETNILDVLRVTAALLPILKHQPNAALMATSSALAFVPSADFPTYCATKAFLHSWLQSLRHQLRNVPVEVLELAPPYRKTGGRLAGCRTAARDEYSAYSPAMVTIMRANRSDAGYIKLGCGSDAAPFPSTA
jgi:short-subunit dehydrogenase involved in D-alanine esterification of teichoic acids